MIKHFFQIDTVDKHILCQHEIHSMFRKNKDKITFPKIWEDTTPAKITEYQTHKVSVIFPDRVSEI